MNIISQLAHNGDMFSENHTSTHTRDAHGNVTLPEKHKNRSGLAKFVGGIAASLAFGLLLTGLLLHGALQANASQMRKISDLERQTASLNQELKTKTASFEAKDQQGQDQIEVPAPGDEVVAPAPAVTVDGMGNAGNNVHPQLDRPMQIDNSNVAIVNENNSNLNQHMNKNANPKAPMNHDHYWQSTNQTTPAVNHQFSPFDHNLPFAEELVD